MTCQNFLNTQKAILSCSVYQPKRATQLPSVRSFLILLVLISASTAWRVYFRAEFVYSELFWFNDSISCCASDAAHCWYNSRKGGLGELSVSYLLVSSVSGYPRYSLPDLTQSSSSALQGSKQQLQLKLQFSYCGTSLFPASLFFSLNVGLHGHYVTGVGRGPKD